VEELCLKLHRQFHQYNRNILQFNKPFNEMSESESDFGFGTFAFNTLKLTRFNKNLIFFKMKMSLMSIRVNSKRFKKGR
jgi:hypothetical protein